MAKILIKNGGLEVVKIYPLGIFEINGIHFLFSLKIKNTSMITQSTPSEEGKACEPPQKNWMNFFLFHSLLSIYCHPRTKF